MKNKKRLIILLAIPVVLGVAAIGVMAIIAASTHSNPPVVSEPNWDSTQTRALADRACFDCHSNETSWPFYTALPGLNRRISHNVAEGREHLNFSQWGSGRNVDRQLGEMIETINEGQMPPSDYASVHLEARLSNAERQQLIDGLRATFGNGSAEIGPGLPPPADEENEGQDGDD